ncbi:hypothetical protein JCM1841_003692 [Sporobolomyces salmonicolor]
MSYEGQAHHPHTAGHPPNAHLIAPSLGGYLPPGLHLVQAHWFVRHGERAPVRQRLVGKADIPAVFQFCSVARDFATAVLSFAPTSPSESSSALATATSPSLFSPTMRHVTTHGSAQPNPQPRRGRLEVKRFTEDVGGGRPSRGGMADCYWGELTDLGRLSTLSLGFHLRRLYIDQLSFLPPTLDSISASEQVAFRSTAMPRTIESLHQVIEGLWGREQREAGLQVGYQVRNWMDENLYPNTHCRRLRELDTASIKEAARLYNPTLAPLDAVLAQIVGDPLRIDSSPRANGILDTVLACHAHGVKVPPELDDPTTLRTLENAVVHEWFDAYKLPEFKKLAMGRLFRELGATMEAKIGDPEERTEKLRLAVYSCHDTSVAGILNALGVFDHRWPPFTSHVAIELFRSAPPPPSSSSLASFLPALLRPSRTTPHFVRLRFNGLSLRLPACAAPGKHLEGSEGEVCTWEAFKSALAAVECSEGEWKRACGEE